MDDEKRAELEEAVTDGRTLAETVNTDGWQKIIKPTFEELRQSYFNKLMEANTLSEMFKASAAVKSIDILISDKNRNIEGDVDRRIREGQEAAETLAKEKPKKKTV